MKRIGSWTNIEDTAGVIYTDKTNISGMAYDHTMRCISLDGGRVASALAKPPKQHSEEQGLSNNKMYCIH